MRKILSLPAIFVLAVVLVTGCAKQESQATEKAKNVSTEKAEQAKSTLTEGQKAVVLESATVNSDDPLFYLPIMSAEVSSFDTTPDWAPAPVAMAAADKDMLTRWSSDYEDADQWIYFDLGTESVVNEVVIRWERAYATKYIIMASKDAKEWQEVYREDNGKGGTMEAKFSPVKCRYIKVLGKEKVDENWGISIWEAEIYGPKSHNPQATVSKEQYLSKDEEDSKKKEAEELVGKNVAPVVPLSEKPVQQGIVYTSWMSDEFSSPASDFTLVKLKQMGFDTIAIMVPAYQKDLDSKEIFTNDYTNGDTPTEESIKHAIETCHKLGLRVLLKPHVDPRTNEARVNIMPSEEWFASYEKFILRYADLAQKNNVEIFSIGTELEATTFSAWETHWKNVIKKVREIYKGALTYSANWTEYKEVPFWQELDLIGIDAYFPLTSKDDASMEELVAGWNKHADDIEAWLKEKGLVEKGVVFTEVGYTSTKGTNRQPWVALTAEEDQQEQADCLEATFEVFSKRPWFKGYYLWQYMPQERWSPLGFTINGKKAEEVVKKWIVKFNEAKTSAPAGTKSAGDEGKKEI